MAEVKQLLAERASEARRADVDANSHSSSLGIVIAVVHALLQRNMPRTVHSYLNVESSGTNPCPLIIFPSFS